MKALQAKIVLIGLLKQLLLLLRLGLFFFFNSLPTPANGQIDSNHFCNLISQFQHELLRLESFSVLLSDRGGNFCEIRFVEGGRQYSAVVDLTGDSLRKPARHISSSDGAAVQQSIYGRSPGDPLTWSYTVDLTEAGSLTVVQTDNGTHLRVDVTERGSRGARMEEESFTFTGDRRLQAAHSVVLGPKSWAGYLFFADSTQGEGDGAGKGFLIGVISICEFLNCQYTGGPPWSSSARPYVDQLRVANLLKPFLGVDQYQPYYVLLRGGVDQLTVAKSGRESLAVMHRQQLFKNRRKDRAWPPLPLGFFCRTVTTGLKVYLFDQSQALVHVFDYLGLGGSAPGDSFRLKTVPFWSFFNCDPPSSKPRPTPIVIVPTPPPPAGKSVKPDVVKPDGQPDVKPGGQKESPDSPPETADDLSATATDDDEQAVFSFTTILMLMGLVGGIVLLTSVLLYCCCCRRRARAGAAASRLTLEHSTNTRRTSRYHQQQEPGQRGRGRRMMMMMDTFGGGGGQGRVKGGGRPTMMTRQKRGGKSFTSPSDFTPTEGSSSSKSTSGDLPVRTSLELPLPMKRQKQQPKTKQKLIKGGGGGGGQSPKNKGLITMKRGKQQPFLSNGKSQQGSIESEGMSKCLPGKKK